MHCRIPSSWHGGWHIVVIIRELFKYRDRRGEGGGGCRICSWCFGGRALDVRISSPSGSAAEPGPYVKDANLVIQKPKRGDRIFCSRERLDATHTPQTHGIQHPPALLPSQIVEELAHYRNYGRALAAVAGLRVTYDMCWQINVCCIISIVLRVCFWITVTLRCPFRFLFTFFCLLGVLCFLFWSCFRNVFSL